MTDFHLSVPFPQAAERSARLPGGLEYCHPELRTALEAAAAGRAHLDECRQAVNTCGLPTPHPERTKLEAQARDAEADGAGLFEAAQLLAAAQADRWAEHLRRRYFQAAQRIEAAAADLAAAYADAVNCARLLPVAKGNPASLAVPHGGPVPAVAVLLSPVVTTLREKAASLPGVPA